MIRYDLKSLFLETWPVTKLQSMQLDEYTNLDKSTSFCYWLEARTNDVGSIWGGSAYKFGIYKKQNPKQDKRNGYLSDNTYAWLSKYGPSAQEAFTKVRALIVKTAMLAQNNQLAEIDNIDLGYAYKWKIAFLYSHYQVINIFQPKAIYKAAEIKGLQDLNIPISAVHKYLLGIKTPDQDFYNFTDQLWQSTGETPPEPPKGEVEDIAPSALNTILYGPPGTGKTYNTINMAVAIANPGFDVADATRELVKQEYDRLIKDEQIVFTTFHQSLSYEDFIEGIKPVLIEDEDVKPEDIDQQIQYKIEPGIFIRLCNKAAYKPDVQVKGFYINKEQFDKATFFKISLGNTNIAEDSEIYKYCIHNNCVALGWGGYTNYQNLKPAEVIEKAKSTESIKYARTAINTFINYLKVGDYILVSNGNNYCRAIGRITGQYFYKETDEIEYCQFRPVEWLIKNVHIPVAEVYGRSFTQRSIYQLDKPAIKIDFFVKSSKDLVSGTQLQAKNHVLIIDEINRGNVSQIFGELITLIEDDKRMDEKGKESLSVTLPYSKKRFSVPSNLYIIGTMNTADRSVEALDTALRRRFHFVEMLPDAKHKEIFDVEGIDLKEVLAAINLRLEKLLSRDHMIGHSFFLKLKSLSDLYHAFYNKIIPQLQEYFFGDFGKIGLVLGKAFFEDKVSEAAFADFDYEDKDLLIERRVYRIRNFLDVTGAIQTTEFKEAVIKIIK